jgi:hypothetical protein
VIRAGRQRQLAGSGATPQRTALSPLSEVLEAVLALRRRVGMVIDPRDLDSVSACSFFVNPLQRPLAPDPL